MVETKSGLKLRYCAYEAIAGNCASFHHFASVIQAWPKALSQPPPPPPPRQEMGEGFVIL